MPLLKEREGRCCYLREKWQGREDSNLRPSVLETDALTKLSYAPIGSMRATRAGRPNRILTDPQKPTSAPN